MQCDERERKIKGWNEYQVVNKKGRNWGAQIGSAKRKAGEDRETVDEEKTGCNTLEKAEKRREVKDSKEGRRRLQMRKLGTKKRRRKKITGLQTRREDRKGDGNL